AEVSARTYAALLERAGTALGLGQPVLVDATFAGPDSRGAVEELAARTASDLVVLECRCPAQLAATRMRARLAAGTDVSGADESVARAMAATAAGHWAGVLAVDTSGTLQQSVEHVLASGLLPPVAGPTAAAAGRSAGR
ncbi:MAG TPA: AAA family ATPase, partial [Acidimicrobiales bacterium]|nr:AAA family ATPase [Acidimicrobiales bacterium]